MRRTTLLSGLAALPALAGIAAPAQADIVFGTISGSVTQAGAGVPGVLAGSPVMGSYSYDNAVLVNNPFFGPVNPLSTFSLSIGSNPHVFGLGDVDIFGSGPLRLPPASTPTTDALVFFFSQAALESFMGTPGIGADNNVTGGNPETLATGLVGDPDHSLTFTFAATVPEPGISTLLAGMGLAGAAGYVRRRRMSRTA